MARETLTREQIVAAAIELLDADGIDGLSMRKLGQQIGSAATSMYWHVGSKENLIVLTGDHVWGEVALPDIDQHGWREAAATLARDTYAMLTRHHWLVSAVTTHFVYGPGMARYQDHNYGIYEAAGFTGLNLDYAFDTVFNFVFGAAVSKSQEITMRARLDRDPNGEAKLAEVLRSSEQVASAFARLAARLREHRDIQTPAAERDAFDYGLSTILDGLEAKRPHTP